jgi:nitrous oxidase accessory protein NosD
MNLYNNSKNNTIKKCIFYLNRLGLKSYRNSEDNLIYNNNFINNLNSAYDEGSNQWDNGIEGNYWSNYKDIDENDDKIWDHIYKIEGGENEDRFPLVCPINN